MKWPFVSRSRFDDLQKNYDELRASTDALVKTLAESSSSEQPRREEHKTAYSRPTLSDIRAKATAAARAGNLTRGA